MRENGRGAPVLFLLAAFLLAWTPASAIAQEADTSLAGRFQLADSYYRAGQFDRAINLFEDLYADSPSTFLIYERLKESYESVKRFDDAIRLVEDRGRRSGQSIEVTVEKARLLYLAGQEKAALATWDEALKLDPRNRNYYRAVYLSMAQVRLVDRAIEILERGRKEIGPTSAFESDLAALYQQAGKHELAMQEYLNLLDGNAGQLNFIRTRLNRLIEQEGAIDAAIDVTERAIRRDQLNRGYREILAWLYTEKGEFALALETYRAIDRLEKEGGRVLFGFARRVMEAGEYDVAREAYEEVLERYPSGPIRAEVLLGLAELHELKAKANGEHALDESGNRQPAPEYERSLALLQQFVQEFPAHQKTTETIRRIGVLQRDVFGDLTGAHEAFEQVVQRRREDEPTSDQAELELGTIAVMEGDLDEARIVLNRLAERLRTGELAARTRLELALIHFYKGEFDLARDLAATLDENTSMDVANDAIELKVLLMENKGPDSTDTGLQMYARAHLLQKQRKFTGAITLLDSMITSLGNHPLLDDVRYLRAEALRETGRIPEAVTAFGEIPLMHPTSYLADQALFSMGELQEQRLGDRDAALQTYTRLLEEYPGSLLAAETRIRIRTLRGDGI